MADLREDEIVYPRMIQLSSCLCTELEASGLPAPCFCGLLPGGDVAFDFCDGECEADGCGGQAWVRLVSIFPSSEFPNPDLEEAICSTRLAYILEVGVTRCAPAMDSQGSPPSMQAQLDAVRLQMADMAAMRRAIACCMAVVQNLNDPYSTADYVLGEYTPYPMSGGCLGGSWQVTTW